ncbi:RagB/SusD family nutrient uptake outer membrane protein [uncultured Alistipes sp.]|jgi:putative outer membrane protein|uniref:RagB/SusD family nutrient uptake outer membrane protein n=1 Tax=uncultured Alistipes sp. TaxID=538949 RepID=UPI0025DB649C|nr:RagB/SusD family nutrient uptake outer membrane protein [uncultured Alistipes sp.]
MKTLKSVLFAVAGSLVCSCSNLDLTPKSEITTGNWFQTAEQFEMNLNALLHHTYWPIERNEWGGTTLQELESCTDDMTNRQSVNAYLLNTMAGANGYVTHMWLTSYRGINRCNKILNEITKYEGVFDQERYDLIVANARFYRACFYARLMVHFGDPVVVPQDLNVELEADRQAAYELSRTDKWVVLEDVFQEFREVAQILPVVYDASMVERATRGAAYGMMARYALHFASIRKWDTFGDENPAEAARLFGVARDAAKDCMELSAYTLHSNFEDLFRNSTKHSPEGIFIIPRSKALTGESSAEYLHGQAITAKLPRLSGAPTCTTCCPSWDLLCAFLCTDGLPIDESPIYNPNKPFENRDPRCAYTIVEHGTEHLGVIYEPHFDAATVYSSREGKTVTNNDSQSYRITANSNQYASYNGLVLKKMVDNDWLSPFEAENDKLILRYADLLLIYAEAKIELNEIDNTVHDAMNMVRARAYGVAPSATTRYPAITETDQAKIRTILRAERRMELAFEALRLYDIWRWRIGETVLNYPNMGLPRKNEKLQRAWIDDGMWFHGAVPQIDENGCPDFMADVARGEASFFRNNVYAQVLSTRIFVAPKRYLWPIPTATLQVMKNVEDNTGY